MVFFAMRWGPWSMVSLLLCLSHTLQTDMQPESSPLLPAWLLMEEIATQKTRSDGGEIGVCTPVHTHPMCSMAGNLELRLLSAGEKQQAQGMLNVQH